MTTEYSDTQFENHAQYLDENTTLTEKEAEAYFRHYFTDIEVPNRKIADEMGISESTFSTHFSKANNKLEGEEAHLNGLKQLFVTTDIGNYDGKTKQFLSSTSSVNGLFILTEESFKNNDKCDYHLHIVYESIKPEIDFEDAPDNIIHYNLWEIFTIQGIDEKHLVDSTMYYVEQLESLDMYDKFAVYKLFDELNFECEHVDIDVEMLL